MTHTTTPTFESLQGSVPSTIAYKINFNSLGIATGRALANVNVTTRNVLVSIVVQVVTAFNAGTTNVVTIGTNGATIDNIFGAADITEGTVGFYGPKFSFISVSDTIDIKYVQTGTVATTGSLNVFITFTPVP